MTDATKALLAANVGYASYTAAPAAMQAIMDNCLSTAQTRLSGENSIDIDETNPEDVSLLVMFAAWLFRSRATGDAKPEMLKSTIRQTQIRNALTEVPPNEL